MRFLQRLGPAGDLFITPSFAGVTERLAGPRAHEDLDAFFEARLGGFAVEPMFHVVFGHAAAEADVQPPAGENIQHGALFGEPHRDRRAATR